MKYLKLTLSTLFVCMLFLASDLHADAWAKRRGCGLFHKRYKVLAKTIERSGYNTRTPDCSKKYKTCSSGGVTAYCRARRTDGSSPFSVIYAEAEARSSASEFYADYWAGPSHRAGLDVYDIVPDLSVYPMIEDERDNRKAGRLSAQFVDINHESRTITLKGIKGHMLVNSSDPNDFSAFTISVTYEEEQNATDDPIETDQQYLDNLLWAAKAVLNNGKLNFNNKFDLNNFYFSSERSASYETRVAVDIEEITIPVSEGYDMDKIVVNIGVDGGNYGFGISEKFRVREVEESIEITQPLEVSEVFNFQNYPNPVSETINVNIELPESQEVQVFLFDINGTVEQRFYGGTISAGRPFNFTFDTKDIKPGIYFLKLVTEDRALTRKIIVSH